MGALAAQRQQAGVQAQGGVQAQAGAEAPAAAVDTRSAAAEADPNVSGTAATAQGGVNAARQASDSTSPAAGDDSEASPEEQASYEKAMRAVQTVLYDNDQTSDSIARMLQPEQKIDSTVQATLLTISEIDKKIDMDEGVIAQVAMDTTDMIIDLGEQGKGIQYSEQEAQAVWGSVWEGTMEMYGIDEEEYADFTEGMSDKEVSAQESQYKQFLGE